MLFFVFLFFFLKLQKSVSFIFEFEKIKLQMETESEKNENIIHNSENVVHRRLEKLETNVNLSVNQKVHCASLTAYAIFVYPKIKIISHFVINFLRYFAQI